MDDPLTAPQQALVDFFDSHPVPTYRWFDRSELIAALGKDGFSPNDVMLAIAQLQNTGLVLKGPVTRDTDDPKFRLDRRTKI